MDNKSKSNRAQADYFELLVCQYICHLYNITFSYSKDMAELSNKVLSMEDGKDRLTLQNDHFIKIEPKIKEILDFEIKQKGKVIDVIWVGRKLSIITTSDVDAEHISKRKTRFSIKSIAKSGQGTLKNLGLRMITKYMNVDFSNDCEDMWNSLRDYLNDYSSSKKQIKKIVQKNENMLSWAKNNGKEYQKKLNDQCFKAFNSLSLSNKINFLNFISDSEDDDLYVIIVNSKGVLVYKPIEKNLKLINVIEAKKDNAANVGYSIYINNIPTYRVQTNNTNGIGISPFCQRIFWI